jgi:hypothetical protein
MNRLLLISLRGAPGHVHLGAIDPRPVYGTPKANSVACRALIETYAAAAVCGRVLPLASARVWLSMLVVTSSKERSDTMIVLGLILLLIGLFAKISILTTIGIVLLVIGAVLFLLGATGRAVGGRKHWY